MRILKLRKEALKERVKDLYKGSLAKHRVDNVIRRQSLVHNIEYILFKYRYYTLLYSL